MKTLESTIWPGPRPYSEDRAHLFFGRDKEVDLLVDGTFERMFILSAESGSGKSSLLAAGYIPELRRRRAAGMMVPPVLLLREWGSGAADADQRLLTSVFAAVSDMGSLSNTWRNVAKRSRSGEIRTGAEAIASMLDKDAERLAIAVNEIQNSGDTTSPWQRLCGSDGLVLVLDQFEEFMGSAAQEWDPQQAQRAIDAIGRLYRDESHVKIVIALRTEYCRTLYRLLNRYVRNLDRRTVDLAPLPAISIQRVVKNAAEIAGVPCEQAESFVGMIVPAGEKEHGSQLNAFSLLGVQALLYGYEQWMDGHGRKLVLSTKYLKEYFATLREPGSVPSTAIAAGDVASEASYALKHWVHTQLNAAAVGPGDLADAGLACSRTELARWMLQPLMPRFATHGGYKQHLLELSIHQELVGRLLPGAFQSSEDSPVRKALQDWLEGDELPALGGLVLGPVKLSGVGHDLVQPSHAKEGSSEESQALVAECLLTMKQVLQRLQKAGVIKLIGQRRWRSWELVHDGLSEYVRSWAEDLARTPSLALGQPVQIRGDRFLWKELRPGNEVAGRLRVVGVQWIGTTLEGADFRDVTFDGCDFTGMYFENCTFTNVTFDNCTLNAAVFKGTRMKECSFDNVSFNYCRVMSTAFINCGFGKNIQFLGELPPLSQQQSELNASRLCNLMSVSFTACSMTSGQPLMFEQCILRFAQIGRIAVSGMSMQEKRPDIQFHKCDMMNAWVWDAGSESVKIDEHCRTIGLVSYDLPLEAWLDRDNSPTLKSGK